MNESTLRPGVRVRIVNTAGDSGQSRYIGRVGSFVRVNGFGSYRHYMVSVRIDSFEGVRHELVRATEIELAPEPKGLGAEYAATFAKHGPFAAGGPINAPYGRDSIPEPGAAGPARKVEAPSLDEPAPEVLLDVARLQAATFAHQLLPTDAGIDELIAVAEWAMGERTVDPDGTTGTVNVPPLRTVSGVFPIPTPPGVNGWETAKDRVLESVDTLEQKVQELGDNVERLTDRLSPPSTAGAIDEDALLYQAEQLVARRLTIRSVEVNLDQTDDEDVVEITTDGEAFLDARQVDELIAYLQAAKRVHAARWPQHY